jgi:putative two-component system response regulator
MPTTPQASPRRRRVPAAERRDALIEAAVLTHHERWDGSGPAGIAAEEIPVAGRIAAVADVFDALTSERVYRPAFPVGLAVEMMQAERGRHFEPAMLDAMHAAFDHIDAVRREYAD